MIDIRDILLESLSELNLPVFLQGSLSDEEAYPDLFITFWNNATESDSFYDNTENAYLWDFDVNVYGIDPSEVWNTLISVKLLLKSNGFTFISFNDIMSDEESHTGRGMNVIYYNGGNLYGSTN